MTIKMFFKLSAMLFLLFPIGTTFAAGVSTSSPEASEIAKAILKKGGSAVDAACAAQFAINVTQPYFAGVGGGGFALVAKKGQTPESFDFRESTRARQPKPSPGLNWTERNTGDQSIAIPGFVKGCGLMHSRFGRLSWKEILEPATQLAKEGFKISKLVEEEQADQWSRIQKFGPIKEVFKGQGGQGLKQGETLKQEMLSRFLNDLSIQGAESFYTGKLGKDWTKDALKQNVEFLEKDLNSYKVIEKPSVRVQFRNDDFYFPDQPTAASLLVGGSLQVLDAFYKKSGIVKPDSVERVLVLYESFHFFSRLRDEKIADGSSFEVGDYLKSEEFKKHTHLILDRVGKRLKGFRPDSVEVNSHKPSHEIHQNHTAHVSVVDQNGMSVSITNSIGAIYGSAVLLPNAGFILNSTAGDFSPDLKSPNAIGPNKRPTSNMSPTLIFTHSETPEFLGAIGGAGGSLIPTSLVQWIDLYFVHGMSAKDALAYPRVEPKGSDGIEIENKFNPALIKELTKAQLKVSSTDTIWAILQTVVKRAPNAKEEAASDPRYDGLAIVF